MNSNVSKALRNIVAERDSYTCVICDAHYSDMHHITPRSQGGRNNPYNLVSLCRRCHAAIHGDICASDVIRYGYDSPRDYRNALKQTTLEYLCDYYAADEEFWAQYEPTNAS